MSRRNSRIITVVSSTIALIACVLSLRLFFTEPDGFRPFFEQPANWWRVGIMLVALVSLVIATRRYVLDKKSDQPAAISIKAMRVLGIILPLLALVFTTAQLINPEFAALLVRKEDWPWFRNAIFIKFACQIVALVCFVIIAVRYAKKKQWLGLACSIGLCLVLLVMAGEELSWGQRIFGWDTPAAMLTDNEQGEMNLHNRHTQLFQNTLYFGGWLLLIALPLWRKVIERALTKCRRLKPLRFVIDLLPPAGFLLLFAVGFGFSDPLMSETGIYYSSNLFILIGTFIALLIMLTRKFRARSESSSGRAQFFYTLLILVVFIIVAGLNLGYSKVWVYNAGAPTEYLEMYISFGIMLWAINCRKTLAASKSLATK